MRKAVQASVLFASLGMVLPDSIVAAAPARSEDDARPQWVTPAIRAPRVEHRIFDSAAGDDGRSAPSEAAAGNHRYFFGFSKSLVRNAVPMQQRGSDAVRSINDVLANLGFANRVLNEPVRGFDEYTTNPSPFLVTSAGIKKELDAFSRTLGTNDTVVIYSHSHGAKGQPERLGGLILDDPGFGRPQRRCLDWSEYAEQLLRFPAQTVVVLTMSCYSGGLVDYLNGNAKARSLWQDRKEHGRNFLVISSQNARAQSNPRQIDGKTINPFTHAVIKAFEGGADGYRRGRTGKQPDAQITLGELADFVVDEARKHTQPRDRGNDPDPQMTGSYNPEFVIAARPAPRMTSSQTLWRAPRGKAKPEGGGAQRDE